MGGSGDVEETAEGKEAQVDSGGMDSEADSLGQNDALSPGEEGSEKRTPLIMNADGVHGDRGFPGVAEYGEEAYVSRSNATAPEKPPAVKAEVSDTTPRGVRSRL
ncbi:hypothetical protein C7M84_008009 [Penaeus vannamei]|uniref:Uncharacterized protein n=1 Tax=Penaeus vannamei TaxID=6689 RepID=A0A423TAZ2_PENVA|nr:uncharacterized protein LOC113809373 [Penaeus vannamei]ROT73562.1 hypothetical protein C7M84_008009 [Penaeus vannamei]